MTRPCERVPLNERVWGSGGCTARPVYIACPDVLRPVGETSYGMWVGFIESDKVLTIFLFIYLYLRCKSALVQLIK
jgi:hypothetical protein